jgi:hypothetical protein
MTTTAPMKEGMWMIVGRWSLVDGRCGVVWCVVVPVGLGPLGYCENAGMYSNDTYPREESSGTGKGENRKALSRGGLKNDACDVRITLSHSTLHSLGGPRLLVPEVSRSYRTAHIIQ